MTQKGKIHKINYSNGAPESVDKGNFDFWFSTDIRDWVGRRRKTAERILREQNNEAFLIVQISKELVKSMGR